MGEGMGELARSRKSGNRDDFSASVKTELAKRVNYHCSVCDAQTVAAKAGADSSFNIGKAAHIKAAAAGGPRYDATQTPEERRSIQNGMWVCANCGDIIDRDENTYPSDHLHELKKVAEQRARERLGKPPQPFNPVPKSHADVLRGVKLFCLSEEARCAQLDPRFNVSVGFANNALVYELYAREPVPTTFTIGAKDVKRFSRDFKRFHEYGGAVEFENIDFSMKGSPLFPDAAVACRRIEFATQKHAITLTIAVGEHLSHRFDFSGHGTSGAKGIAFSGHTCGQLVTAKLTADFRGDGAKLTLSTDFGQWAKKPVGRLPHFVRARQFIQAIRRANTVAVSLESDGIENELGVCSIPESDFFPALDAFLYEVSALRELDAFFGLGLAMPEELEDLMDTVENFSSILSLIGIHKTDTPEITMTFTPPPRAEDGAVEDYTNISSAIETQKPVDLFLTQEVTLNFQDKSFGPFVVEVSCPQALVNTIGPAQFIPGTPTQLSLRPAEGHQWSARNGGLLTTYEGPSSMAR